MRHDLRSFGRALRRSPASAAAAILTLTLTLGVGASVLAVVDAVLLTDPPFTNPDRLVVLGEVPADRTSDAPRPVRYGRLEAWRERAGSLAVIEAYEPTNITLTGLGAAERVNANDVTPGLLPLLGITPAQGRSFAPDDVAQPVAIVSATFWRTRLTADAAVIGRQIVLGGVPHTIVGVLREDAAFPLRPADVWRPIPMTADAASRSGYQVRPIARLGEGVPATSLADALASVSRAGSPSADVVATRVQEAITGNVRTPLTLVAGAAALALLVAFTNLCGLLMVRALDRRHELAVRSALGAPRFDPARQMLGEAALVVAAGTAGGLLLAAWVTPTAARLALERFGARADSDISLTGAVAVVVTGAAAALACVCALLSAVPARRRDAVTLLRQRSGEAPRELALRRGLIVVQVAIAFVLLVSAAMLGGSLARVLDTDPGFNASGLQASSLSLPAARYPTLDSVSAFYAAVQDAVESRLGPRTVAIVDELPLTGDSGRVRILARPGAAGEEAVLRVAGRAYFDVMSIPLVSGRAFDDRDDSTAPRRIVVSRTLARRLIPDGDPVGRQVTLEDGPVLEIIGVVGDVSHRALDERLLPTVYFSARQLPSRSSRIVLRDVDAGPDPLGVLREEVAKLDADLPVYGNRSMQEIVTTSPGVPARELLTTLAAVLAGLAMVLSAVGLFGLMAHDVARRRLELAVRIAVGADPLNIVRGILARGAVTVMMGVAFGGLLSMWAAQAIGQAFARSELDGAALAAAAATMVIVGIVAGLAPARHAARTDPLLALRGE